MNIQSSRARKDQDEGRGDQDEGTVTAGDAGSVI